MAMVTVAIFALIFKYAKVGVAMRATANDQMAALLQIDFDNVGKWAIDKGITFTNFKNLTGLPEVFALIKAEVEKTNQQFARVENVRRFKLLTKELDHDDDEMTATMKIRRANVYKKFAAEIDAVYS
ncbi:MAG: hypothetical protein J7L25_02950 [Deltaproteobacteria bacterium]|nr:hypothetical protein [Candidatus Tharpella aukensis]